MKKGNNLSGKIILVVAAHPDDAEFGCGGTVAKWIQAGATAYYIVATSGNRGSRHHQIEHQALIDSRRQEQLNAASVIGAKEIFFLDHEDGNLVAHIELKEQIVKLIRKLKPDFVFTHDPSWFYSISDDHTFINHNDHRQTGEATLDAVYPLARDLASFPEHAQEGITPHKVEEVYLFNFEKCNYFEDISSTVDTKIKAILEHKSQVDDPEKLSETMKKRMAKVGKRAGLQYAEGFTKLDLK